MKDSSMYVVTADQKHSRTAADRVPALLADLQLRTRNGTGTSRPFERTAGDEVQGLLDDPAVVVEVVVTLLRGGWWVGIGVGAVEEPLPDTARAGRGPAYLAARQAVESAKAAPAGICVSGGEAARRAEAAAWLLGTLLARRTPQGWQVVDLVSQGAKGVEAAAKLGISPQAVSSRLRVAGWAEEQRGRELMAWLLEQADLADRPAGEPQTKEDAR
jgi:hypothetical protein